MLIKSGAFIFLSRVEKKNASSLTALDWSVGAISSTCKQEAFLSYHGDGEVNLTKCLLVLTQPTWLGGSQQRVKLLSEEEEEVGGGGGGGEGSGSIRRSLGGFLMKMRMMMKILSPGGRKKINSLCSDVQAVVRTWRGPAAVCARPRWRDCTRGAFWGSSSEMWGIILDMSHLHLHHRRHHHRAWTAKRDVRLQAVALLLRDVTIMSGKWCYAMLTISYDATVGS